MSHIKSFLDAPIREDRGRRILLEKSHYQDFNFLHDHRPVHEQFVHPVGVSSGRQSHFKVGFFRRPASQIRQDEQRLQHERHVEERRVYQMQLRRDLKTSNEGETMLITGEHKDNHPWMAQHALPASAVREPQFQSKRHFAQSNSETVPEEGRIGFGKFASKLTPEQLERRRQRMEEYARRREQTSSLLGYGRSDLPSHGVLDNFLPITRNELSEMEARRARAGRSASLHESSSSSSSSSSSRPYVISQVFPSAHGDDEPAPFARKTRHVKSQIAFLFGDTSADHSNSSRAPSSQSAPSTSHGVGVR